jgi:hypothetical protein
MQKWGVITFSIGIALVLYEIYHATRKKEGFVHADKQRVVGLFWLTCFVTALVVGLLWLTGAAD